MKPITEIFFRLRPENERNRIRPDGQIQAFTLMEVVIALAVLSIGIVAGVGYLPVSLDAAQRSLRLTQATFSAQNRMAEISAAAFSNITNADAFDTAGAFIPDPDYSGFSDAVSVTTPNGNPNLRQVNVTVQWLFKSRTFSENFQTVVAKYNPG